MVIVCYYWVVAFTTSTDQHADDAVLGWAVRYVALLSMAGWLVVAAWIVSC
jgi:hypothetical protein